ncbi:MAG TPA: endonuclease domain-containing protein [Thermohalobaculum sp.]|nr:endonuclease domain-containing protein [Thermohalobaculum sp.]
MQLAFRRDGKLVVRARRLRRDMTDAERRLWSLLRRDALGVRFRRQMVIDSRYIVDFYCPAAKLAIELDGGQHALRTEADARRTRALTARGVTVLRFWNNEVLRNAEGVLAAIAAVLAETARRTPSLSLGSGERSTGPFAAPAQALAGGGGAGRSVALDALDVAFGEPA